MDAVDIVEDQQAVDLPANGASEENPDTPIGLGEEVVRLNTDIAYTRTVSLPLTTEEERDRRRVAAIVKTLLDNGYKDIETVQKMPGRRLELTFGSVQAKINILQSGIQIRGRHRTVYDSEIDVLNVTLCGVPAEIPTKDLYEHMSTFGEIKGFYDKMEKVEDVEIKNGSRVFQFKQIDKIFPTFFKIEGTPKTIKVVWSNSERFYTRQLRTLLQNANQLPSQKREIERQRDLQWRKEQKHEREMEKKRMENNTKDNEWQVQRRKGKAPPKYQVEIIQQNRFTPINIDDNEGDDEDEQMTEERVVNKRKMVTESESEVDFKKEEKKRVKSDQKQQQPTTSKNTDKKEQHPNNKNQPQKTPDKKEDQQQKQQKPWSEDPIKDFIDIHPLLEDIEQNVNSELKCTDTPTQSQTQTTDETQTQSQSQSIIPKQFNMTKILKVKQKLGRGGKNQPTPEEMEARKKELEGKIKYVMNTETTQQLDNTEIQDNVLIYGNGRTFEIGKREYFVYSNIETWKDATYVALSQIHCKDEHQRKTKEHLLKYLPQFLRESKTKIQHQYGKTQANLKIMMEKTLKNFTTETNKNIKSGIKPDQKEKIELLQDIFSNNFYTIKFKH